MKWQKILSLLNWCCIVLSFLKQKYGVVTSPDWFKGKPLNLKNERCISANQLCFTCKPQDICIITKTVKFCRTWRNYIEGDTTLFSSWDFYLFQPISLFYILLVYWCFKTKTRQILSLIAFEIVKSQREEKQKNIISRQFFSFSNFSSFRKFRYRLWYQLKQMFLINYQYFQSYAFFVKILTRNKTYLKNAFKMPLNQGNCLGCIYNSINFHWPKMRGSLVIRAKKCMSYFTWQ